jgi:hypothetical protein
MSSAALIAYGMQRIARIELPDDQTFLITLEFPGAESWEKAIYAFLVGNEIKRVGSSKGRLGGRLKSWSRDVTNALRGRKSPTPAWEAAECRNCLHQHKGGEVYARIATTVITSIGAFPAYMDEESVLINRHQPPLNRHTNR